METKHDQNADGLAPLEGEQGVPSVHQERTTKASWKTIAGGLILIFSVVAALFGILHNHQKTSEKAAVKKAAPVQVVANTASTAPKFDPSKVPDGSPKMVAVDRPDSKPDVPAIEVDGTNIEEGGGADPIGVRGAKSNDGKRQGTSAQTASPLDSSAALVLTSNPEQRRTFDGGSGSEIESPQDARVTNARSQLSDLQGTMKSLMGNLTTMTKPASPASAAPAPKPATLGGQLSANGTARIFAGTLSDRNLTVPRGTMFNCALKTRIVSEQSGFVSCQVLRNVYSENGRVLLIERASHLDGEYTAKYRNGQTRIFVVWSRLRTPNGVVVDIESPATGPLGEAGVEGYVDNHWAQRFGGALLVTLIDDAVKVTVASQQSGASTVVAQDTGDTASKVAEKMLDASVNIPPTIFKNQGEVVGINVAKDVDFSNVYELQVADR